MLTNYSTDISRNYQTGLYRATFIDPTGSYTTKDSKLGEAQALINRYIQSLGYNFKILFYSGKYNITIKYKTGF